MRTATLRKVVFITASLLFSLNETAWAEVPAESLVPGSATMPLKPLNQPNPALPQVRGDVGGIRLGVWVKADGTVDSIDVLNKNPKIQEPVLAAVRNWTFEPAIWEGKPIPARVELSFGLVQGRLMNSLNPVPNLPGELHTEGEFGLTMPALQHDPDLIVPILERATRGKLEAAFAYVIEKDGLPAQFEVLGASSESAYRATINQLANQVYKPGRVRDEAVRVKIKQVISTMSVEKSIEGLTGLQEAMDPVYPYEQLLAGSSGTAKVNFTLAASGKVKSVEIVEASLPDFGLALRAAVESWIFTPESAVETPQRSYEHEFSAEIIPGGVSRLVTMLRKGQPFSSSTAQLDGKPQRAYSPALCYPPELLASGEEGKARIEFVIDRSGLAQIPRILEASNPAFGWAAATWIGSMRFKQMRRAGEPVDLKVSVPVVFKAEKKTE